MVKRLLKRAGNNEFVNSRDEAIIGNNYDKEEKSPNVLKKSIEATYYLTLNIKRTFTQLRQVFF